MPPPELPPAPNTGVPNNFVLGSAGACAGARALPHSGHFLKTGLSPHNSHFPSAFLAALKFKSLSSALSLQRCVLQKGDSQLHSGAASAL
eukprot:7782874-Karenia_brevis.AAC.1